MLISSSYCWHNSSTWECLIFSSRHRPMKVILQIISRHVIWCRLQWRFSSSDFFQFRFEQIWTDDVHSFAITKGIGGVGYLTMTFSLAWVWRCRRGFEILILFSTKFKDTDNTWKWSGLRWWPCNGRLTPLGLQQHILFRTGSDPVWFYLRRELFNLKKKQYTFSSVHCLSFISHFQSLIPYKNVSRTRMITTCEERTRFCNFSNIFYHLLWSWKLHVQYESKQSTVVQVQP